MALRGAVVSATTSTTLFAAAPPGPSRRASAATWATWSRETCPPKRVSSSANTRLWVFP